MGTWVPTAERTPTRKGIYIVTDREEFTNAATRYEVMPLYWDGKNWGCLGSGNHGFAYPVLAWTPLPRAYKEER